MKIRSGRPNLRWEDAFKTDMTEAGLKDDNAIKMAAWRNTIISKTGDPRWRDKPGTKKKNTIKRKLIQRHAWWWWCCWRSRPSRRPAPRVHSCWHREASACTPCGCCSVSPDSRPSTPRCWSTPPAAPASDSATLAAGNVAEQKWWIQTMQKT